MKEIKLPKNNYRGLIVRSGKIIATNTNSPNAEVFNFNGELIDKIKLPCICGALAYHNGYYYCASYTAPKTYVYKLNFDYKVIDKFNYLHKVPPKLLPSSPYDKYANGLSVTKTDILLTLQNCPNIFKFDTFGNFIDSIDCLNNDITGIDRVGNDLFYSDKSKSTINKGDKVFKLKTYCHPFDICIRSSILYVLCSGTNKVLYFNI